MTKRKIELTSLQIKTIEAALMSYIDDRHNAAENTESVTRDYKYQRGLYLHFLFQTAREVTVDVEDPHEIPKVVPAHLV